MQASPSLLGLLVTIFLHLAQLLIDEHLTAILKHPKQLLLLLHELKGALVLVRRKIDDTTLLVRAISQHGLLYRLNTLPGLRLGGTQRLYFVRLPHRLQPMVGSVAVRLRVHDL